MATLLPCCGFVTVAATAWLVTRRLELPSATGALVGAYAIGFAEVVGVSLALSAIDAFRSWTVLREVVAYDRPA